MMDAFCDGLIFNILFDTSNTFDDIIFNVFDDVSYSNTLSKDTILPSSSPYNNPVFDDKGKSKDSVRFTSYEPDKEKNGKAPWPPQVGIYKPPEK